MRVFQATSEPVRAVAFSPDGRHLLAGGGKVGVRVWDTSSNTKPFALKDSSQALAIRFCPRGMLLAPSGLPTQTREWPGGRRLSGGVASWAFPVSSSSLDFTAEGHIVYCAGVTLTCWDPFDRELIWVKATPSERLDQLVCGPEGRIAVVRGSRRLDHCDAASGERVASAELNGTGDVLAMAFSPDGGTLAVAIGFELVLWDVRSWTERTRIRLPVPCRRLGCRPDGSSLIGFTGGTIRVWEPDLSREIGAYDFGIQKVHDMTFAPDGLRAAVGCDDGRVVVWDLD